MPSSPLAMRVLSTLGVNFHCLEGAGPEVNVYAPAVLLRSDSTSKWNSAIDEGAPLLCASLACLSREFVARCLGFSDFGTILSGSLNSDFRAEG